jgi:glycosyltransferase involved in cell wall biosynthesis
VTPSQLTDKKVVIFSHYATTGACEELRDWLRELKVRELVYVAFPFGKSPDRYIRIEQFSYGAPVQTRRSLFRLKLPEPLAYAKDLLYALLYALRFARGAEVLVAGDNLLALAGVLTRWLTGVRHLVYYMIDYTPVRYANRILNTAYYSIDRFAASHADAVWPLSSQIIRGRFESGRLDERRVRWYTVPYGSHPQEAVPASACDRTRVVYMGDVLRSKGAELIVPMAQELERLVPDFRFTVIGGGKDLPALREEVRAAGLENHFDICGFVENIADVVDRLRGAGVAIAPYYPFDANSFTFFSDPGKVKVYLGCGVPIVLTDVPPVAKDIEKEGAGKIAGYDAAGFADAIASILGDDNYLQVRENARRLGERFAWPKVFAEAFARLDVVEKKGITS